MGNFYVIPVPMIKLLFTDTNAYNVLSHVGGYISAKKSSDFDGDGIVRHLTYCYFRKRHELTPEVVSLLEDFYDEDELDDDEGLFRSDGFLNDEELYFWDEANFEEVEYESEPYTPLGLIANACRKKEGLWEVVKEWHDVYLFDKRCNLKINGQAIAATIRLGHENVPLAQNQPYAMINPDFLLNYRDKNKSERARAEFAMLLAISSIQGKKGWSATTRNLIAARMFGAAKTDGLEEALKGNTPTEGKQLKDAYDKYITRRIFDSMRDHLINQGMIKCWAPYSHRVIVSTAHKLDEIESDVLVFLKRKQSPKEQIKRDGDRLKDLINMS